MVDTIENHCWLSNQIHCFLKILQNIVLVSFNWRDICRDYMLLFKVFLCNCGLILAHVLAGKQYLSIKVWNLDHIFVNKTNLFDSQTGESHSYSTSETACTQDKTHLLFQFRLIPIQNAQLAVKHSPRYVCILRLYKFLGVSQFRLFIFLDIFFFDHD